MWDGGGGFCVEWDDGESALCEDVCGVDGDSGGGVGGWEGPCGGVVGLFWFGVMMGC